MSSVSCGSYHTVVQVPLGLDPDRYLHDIHMVLIISIDVQRIKNQAKRGFIKAIS